MNRNAKQCEEDGIRFDSQTEMKFYHNFIRNRGYNFRYHEKFFLNERYMMGGTTMPAHTYTADFVIRDSDGDIAHVYDVKGSLSAYDIDKDAKKTFYWFMNRHRIPVEVVVPRKYDFKMKIFDLPRGLQAKHVKRDKHGNVKRYKKSGNPMFEYYDVHKSVKYDIHDLIGR